MRHGIDEIKKRMKRAIVAHQMLQSNEPVMVGLSGGKDSMTLLWFLKDFLRISKYKFPLAAGHVCLGFPNDDTTKMEAFCKELDVPFYCEHTQIGELIFDVRKEKNPCSLCAKMRRGALNQLAVDHGYRKIALAHHQDDVVETLLLNLMFEGRLGSFKPITELDRLGVTVIRPFIYVPEEQISYFVRKYEIPVSKSNCPQNCLGKRQEMKALLKNLDTLAPGYKDRATGALDRQFGSEWDGGTKK